VRFVFLSTCWHRILTCLSCDPEGLIYTPRVRKELCDEICGIGSGEVSCPAVRLRDMVGDAGDRLG